MHVIEDKPARASLRDLNSFWGSLAPPAVLFASVDMVGLAAIKDAPSLTRPGQVADTVPRRRGRTGLVVSATAQPPHVPRRTGLIGLGASGLLLGTGIASTLLLPVKLSCTTLPTASQIPAEQRFAVSLALAS